jgi:methylenetetrahydrofolate dehydrogenase (NADP+)/methenyltetrahydrofolate cyclohydrolase
MNAPLTLVIVQVGEHPASSQYVRKKMAFANSLGINAEPKKFDVGITEEALKKELAHIVADMNHDPYAFTGIIVQLPLPKELDTEKILAEIPAENDVDLLSQEAIEKFNTGTSRILPPVVGAVAEILRRAHVSVAGKKAVVVGRGKLVGKPAAVWLEHEGAQVVIANRSTEDLAKLTREADIIITGVGSAKLITPAMVKQGVILIDAGTSDSSRAQSRESEDRPSSSSGQRAELVGDADPACAPKCSIFTPVPGGVGPMTVAMLFKNLIELAKAQNSF